MLEKFLKKKQLVTQSSKDENLFQPLFEFSKMDLSQVFDKLASHEKGLHQREVKKRLQKYGRNEIAHDKQVTWYALFFNYLKNPFVVLLIFLGLISYIAGEHDALGIIFCMVVVSIIMRFIQEYRSTIAANNLKKLVSVTATVKRFNGNTSQETEIDIKRLVPGDIIHLSAGDLVPADVRLITSKELYISQGSLTGESLPVEKNDHVPNQKEYKNPVELPNICFMGTSVLNGTAQAIILQTGARTYFGHMAKSITEDRPLTSFDVGINKISWLLIKLMIVMAGTVFAINSIVKGNIFEAFLFSLSVAVGLTPEMLPMIVTANLAMGAMKMAKSKVIVKRLNAIQDFGGMDVLCTDKTGTLTQNKIILEKYLNAQGAENEKVLTFAYLNSYYQTGLKNLLDVAVLNHKNLEKDLQLKQAYVKIDEIPFDFERRRMSVILEDNNKQHVLICKGAFEEVLSVCNQVVFEGEIKELTDEIKNSLQHLKENLSEDGLRVLTVSYKETKEVSKEYTPKDEKDLIFLGYLAFLDPPKSSVPKALALLKEYNVQIKILTGDNELVTKRICQWVNLPIHGILTGSQVEAMDDDELRIYVETTNIFAKLNPLQKTRVISLLKSNGHIVGYLGDGVNDASALRHADVGISVDTAVDIAKESADIIMLEKSLLFLGDGVLEGRRTFGNISKYIKMATSSNFGNILSILGASLLFPFLPMMPVQLLFQNLLYDISQVSIPFDNVDKKFLYKPRQWDPSGIAKFMVCIGPISSLFDYATFAVMWYVFGANTIESQGLFQTGWFIEGLLSQTLIVHMIRTRQIPFFQSIASLPLLLTTLVIMVVGIYVPYSAIGHSIGFVSMPGNYFYWLSAILLAYCIVTQLVKIWFIRQFNFWL